MPRELFSTLRFSVSEQVALRHVAAISQYHRIQASPGFRAAAAYVAGELESAGLSVRTLSYPATDTARYWSLGGWQEWECSEATLDLLDVVEGPERLCDYRSVPTSVIQRSASFDGELEVVLLEDGSRPEHYAGLDVRGKLVLSDGDPEQVYDQAVAQRGAAGIVCDCMEASAPGRSRIDMPDLRRYTSFWWAPGKPKCFGFVITPRQGDKLRQLLRSRAKLANPPAVRLLAHVSSRLYDGAMEVVEARIPGDGDQEIVIIAHLCHPIPSANDNASGSAAALEAACVLQRLIDGGVLPAPQRGVRFLWVPEINGTYAYVAEHMAEVEHWIAGLNLDMVGADQHQTGSIFMIERPPEAVASFAPDLLERLREELFDDVTDLGSGGLYPLFRHGVSGFTGGSDHIVLSDPTVGVPTPMMIQWPDRYWHTSADTLDKVDAKMLGRAAVLAAAYGYWLATAGKDEANWLGQEMTARFVARLTKAAQTAIDEGVREPSLVGLSQVWNRFLRQADFMHDRQVAALATLRKLSPEVEPCLVDLNRHARVCLEQTKDRVRLDFVRRSDISDLDELAPLVREAEAWEEQAAHLIPERRFCGPISTVAHLPRLSPEERLAWNGLAKTAGGGYRTARRLAEYWADGQRTLLEVVDLVELESGHRLGAELLQYFRFLVKMELAVLHEVDNDPV